MSVRHSPNARDACRSPKAQACTPVLKRGLSSDDIGRRCPQFILSGNETGYYEPGAGFVRPELCLEAEFIGLVVDHLTAQGAMEPGLLSESPFTDVAPQGREQIFDATRTIWLFAVIADGNRSAVA